jgi:hypothetical protein
VKRGLNMSGYYTEGVLVNWDDERDSGLTDRYKVWVLDRKETAMSILQSRNVKALTAN